MPGKHSEAVFCAWINGWVGTALLFLCQDKWHQGTARLFLCLDKWLEGTALQFLSLDKWLDRDIVAVSVLGYMAR